jgi:16S rRNA (guanine966-N2)-methyltransferase
MRIISGKYGGRKLALQVSGKNVAVRPTSDKVREAIFSMLQFDFDGTSVLDIFAGTGALGIEALSRGATSVVFVDKSSKVTMGIRKNLDTLGVPKEDYSLQVWPCERFLKRNQVAFDMIFMDPPYELGFVGRTLSLILEKGTLSPGGKVIVEHSSREPIDLEKLPDLTLFKEKSYGETMVTILNRVE